MTATAARCRLCFEPIPGPHRGHKTAPGWDNPYKHDAEAEHIDGEVANEISEEDYADDCTSDENCDHPTHYNGCPMQRNDGKTT